MSTVADILGALDTLAPGVRAAGWDPVGLQVGDPAAPAARVAVCHEITEPVVAALEADPVGLVVAYHPLLFHPTVRLVAGSSPGGRALRLARAGIAAATVHTAFDVAPGGTADALAAALGLDGVTGFGPAWGADSVKFVTFSPAPAADAIAAAMEAAGAGIIGAYTACSFRGEGTGTFRPGPGAAPAVGEAGRLNREPEVRIEMNAPAARKAAVAAALVAAHPYEEPAFDVYVRSGDAGMIGRIGSADTTVAELAGRAAAVLGGVVRRSGDGPARRVACIPGSGGSLLGDAVAAGADVVVTGDVSHHRARELADRGVAVVDPGHAATERPGVAALYAAVAQIAEAVDLTALDPDPWRTT